MVKIDITLTDSEARVLIESLSASIRYHRAQKFNQPNPEAQLKHSLAASDILQIARKLGLKITAGRGLRFHPKSGDDTT